MKQKVEWHEEGLSNSEKSLQKKKKWLEETKKEINEHEKMNAFSRFQINEAKRRGIIAFDRARFCVKRGEKK